MLLQTRSHVLTGCTRSTRAGVEDMRPASLLVGAVLFDTLAAGTGKTTEWFIQTSYNDAQCRGATSAVLEPLETCVKESSSVFIKKACQGAELFGVRMLPV